jgi:molybdate transport system ATP-binding protein
MACLNIDISLSRAAFELQAALSLRSGETTVLMGSSGGGKSTLLRALAGLERPQTGRIALNDRVWFDQKRAIHLPPRRRKVGLLFQNCALFPHLTVAQNIGFALAGQSRIIRNRCVDHWLRRLRISEIAHAYPARISGGQRQRVALARALAAEPDVLLLDEPFSAVDSELRIHLRKLFREVAQERFRPLLLVTHDLEDTRELADRVGVMVDGQLRRFGKVQEVFSDPVDLDAARILGWRNLLPVNSFKDESICGSWGCLPFQGIRRTGRYWLGIEPRHWRITDDMGLAATIEHSCMLGPYRQLTCRLLDGRNICLHHRHDELEFRVGTQIKLQALPEHLVLLREV